MHKFRNLLLAFIAGVTLFSCSNDDFSLVEDQTSKELIGSNNEIKILKFNYKSKVYTSEYYEKGNSVIILDRETQEVYNKLQKNENRLVVVDEDDNITYYDNEAEYLESKSSTPQVKRASPPTPYFKVTVRLYKHVNTLWNPTTSMLIERLYSGRLSSYNSNEIEAILVEYPDLRVYNHNDNISLAKINLSIGNMSSTNNYRGMASLYLYEHFNYQGDYRAGYAATAWNGNNAMKPDEEISDTETIKVKALDGNGKSFNDKASSLKVKLQVFNMNHGNSGYESSPNGGNASGGRVPGNNTGGSSSGRKPESSSGNSSSRESGSSSESNTGREPNNGGSGSISSSGRG